MSPLVVRQARPPRAGRGRWGCGGCDGWAAGCGPALPFFREERIISGAGQATPSTEWVATCNAGSGEPCRPIVAGSPGRARPGNPGWLGRRLEWEEETLSIRPTALQQRVRPAPLGLARALGSSAERRALSLFPGTGRRPRPSPTRHTRAIPTQIVFQRSRRNRYRRPNGDFGAVSGYRRLDNPAGPPNAECWLTENWPPIDCSNMYLPGQIIVGVETGHTQHQMAELIESFGLSFDPHRFVTDLDVRFDVGPDPSGHLRPHDEVVEDLQRNELVHDALPECYNKQWTRTGASLSSLRRGLTTEEVSAFLASYSGLTLWRITRCPSTPLSASSRARNRPGSIRSRRRTLWITPNTTGSPALRKNGRSARRRLCRPHHPRPRHAGVGDQVAKPRGFFSTMRPSYNKSVSSRPRALAGRFAAEKRIPGEEANHGSVGVQGRVCGLPGRISSEGSEFIRQGGEHRTAFVRRYLDVLGAEGWELAGIPTPVSDGTSYFILKRPGTGAVSEG